jgi:hypothetical protein
METRTIRALGRTAVVQILAGLCWCRHKRNRLLPGLKRT